MIAIVLSGGFALGSFEVGAVRYLYNIGVHPDIICGTSVGSINGVKLAEGEGTDPNTNEPTGLAGMEKMWLEYLHQNSDVYIQGPFLISLQETSPEIYQEFINAGLIVPDPDPGPLSPVVTGTTNWIFDIGQAISTSGHFIALAVNVLLGNLQLPMSLFDQQPVLDLISQHLNLQLVYEWANQGGQLRFATVGLKSGKVRYATQNGQILERDNSTVVSTLPTFQPVPSACQPQAGYLAGLENQLSTLMANRPSPGDPDYEGWLSEVQALNSQINDAQQALQKCKDDNNAPHIPGLDLAINGSLALPVFLIPWQFDDELYVDGGIRDVMPVAMAAELGATQIYAVNDSPPLGPQNSVSNALDIAMRALTGIAIDEVAYEAVHSVKSSSAVNVILIQSTFGLPNDAYTIHPALIRINMSYGYMCAADAVNPTLLRPDRSRQLAEDITALRRILFQFERIAAGPDTSINLPMLRWGKGILALLINERSSLGGPMPTDVTSAPGNWEKHYPWSPPAATPFDAIGPVPAADPASFVPGNNTLLREQYPVPGAGPAPIGTIYIVLGGAGFAIPDAQELAALGLQNAPIQAIPAGAQFPLGAQNPLELHTTKLLPSIPFEGTLIKERGSDSAFQIWGGQKCLVNAWLFSTGRFNADAVLVAPTGGFATIPTGPLVALGLPLTSWVDSQYQHVGYLGADGHVYELYYAFGSGGAWSGHDVSGLAVGSPPGAAPGSPLTSWVDSQYQHVGYLGADGHVYELYYAFGSGGAWSGHDVSGLAVGSPPGAAPGSPLTSWVDSQYQHVGYLGADGHVYELYYAFGSGGAWSGHDVSGLAVGSPPGAAPGSPLTSWVDSQYQHVGYLGADGHVYELYYAFGSGGAWTGHDVSGLAVGSPPPWSG